MKSLGVVALGLICVLLFAFAVKNVLSTSREWAKWEQDTVQLFTAIEVERIVRENNLPILARLDSVSRVGRMAASRSRMRGDSLKGVAESLSVVLSQSQSAPESLTIALQSVQTLEGALGEAQKEIEGLETIIGGQGQMIAVLKLESERAWNLVDSASAVIRRVPAPCKVPLVGIPCPVPSVGIGLTADGIRAYAGIGFQL